MWVESLLGTERVQSLLKANETFYYSYDAFVRLWWQLFTVHKIQFQMSFTEDLFFYKKYLVENP